MSEEKLAKDLWNLEGRWIRSEEVALTSIAASLERIADILDGKEYKPRYTTSGGDGSV